MNFQIDYTEVALIGLIACFWWRAAEMERVSPPLWLGLSIAFGLFFGSFMGMGLLLPQLLLFISIAVARVAKEHWETEQATRDE